MRIFIVGSLAMALCSGAAAGQESLTYEDLVWRLVDLERQATLPEVGETCAQWSSWDRASVYDAENDRYVAWDANGDGGGYIRKEGDEYVFAEMEGPGCIWRIWSARPEKGHVRIYLDGADTPAVDLPFHQYFDGTAEPFTYPNLCYEAAKGQNCYVPIPYQRSCRITADPGWGAYYHFTYTTFPKGTRVPTFTRDLSESAAAALDAVNELLEDPASAPWDILPVGLVSKNVHVRAGAVKRIARLKGSSAIYSITAHIDLPGPPEDIDVLRELALRIRWDGEEEPSVWVPLGDFFGTAAGANSYESLAAGLREDGRWYANWYMPFAEEAVLELINDGSRKREVSFEIRQNAPKRPIEDYGRFHAKWHRDAFLPDSPDRAIDWPMLMVQGRGRFCGVMLHVWNPKGGWWGEGDEKFFVDGERFPSTFGTGSEDYFGYAWCNPTLFTRAFHNQTISMGNRGHVSVNRWHIADNVPFQKSFEGCIEKYFPNDKPCLYAATAFWYQAPGGVDPYGPLPVADRTGYYSTEAVPVLKVPGAIEGEKLRVIAKTAGNVGPQDMGGFDGQWSGLSHLWWTGARPGDRLDLALPVAEPGQYRVVMCFTKANDYGIIQCSMDGQKLRWPIDLYNPSVRPHGPFDMGILDLDAVDHTLTLELTGANPNAIKRYMAGLDYVLLKRVDQEGCGSCGP